MLRLCITLSRHYRFSKFESYKYANLPVVHDVFLGTREILNKYPCIVWRFKSITESTYAARNLSYEKIYWEWNPLNILICEKLSFMTWRLWTYSPAKNLFVEKLTSKWLGDEFTQRRINGECILFKEICISLWYYCQYTLLRLRTDMFNLISNEDSIFCHHDNATRFNIQVNYAYLTTSILSQK